MTILGDGVALYESLDRIQRPPHPFAGEDLA